ncbi:helix-turn-helix domain-containing protein [Candidatus Pacearchaeota archaeon]|nr:helix-turn-helix domain-containing protein [Candidatus Pacearchaeota archaeon]
MEDNQQKRLYDSYIGTLTAKFEVLSRERRDFVIRELESLVAKTLTRSDENLRSAPPSNKLDCEKARKIRVKERLSQTDLSKICDVAQPSISGYETGRYNPYSDDAQSGAKKYLAWLDQHGYSDNGSQRA